jgi:O-antigen ligase
MPATTRMPIRQEILKWAFAIYGILSLGSMATMSIGAIILIFAILFTSNSSQDLKKEIKKEFKNSHSKLYFWTSLCLALTCALSLIIAFLFPLGYGGNFVQVHFFPDMAKAWYLFWPLLLVIGLRRLEPQAKRFVFQSWMITYGILAFYGIFQFFVGWPRFQRIPGEAHHFHATLFFGHHLSTASILVFPFFTSLDQWNISSKRGRVLFLLAALFGAITLYLSYSRMLWVALPIGVFCWCLWVLPKKWKLPALLGLLLILLGVSLYPPIQTRMKDGIGIGQRKDLWLANLEFFKQRPLTGAGWHHNLELSGYYLMEKSHSSSVFSGHAHNNFLDMLGGTGLLGTLSWLAWCGGVLWILFRTKNSSFPYFAHGLICAWLVFHLNGLTQVNFWEAKVQHQMAWVIAWSLLWPVL